MKVEDQIPLTEAQKKTLVSKLASGFILPQKPSEIILEKSFAGMTESQMHTFRSRHSECELITISREEVMPFERKRVQESFIEGKVPDFNSLSKETLISRPVLQEMHEELNKIPDAFVAKFDGFVTCLHVGMSN